MSRKRILWSCVAVVALLFVIYLYGGSSTPGGQQPLVRLDASNLASLQSSFNASANSARVLLLLSPT